MLLRKLFDGPGGFVLGAFLAPTTVLTWARAASRFGYIIGALVIVGGPGPPRLCLINARCGIVLLRARWDLGSPLFGQTVAGPPFRADLVAPVDHVALFRIVYGHEGAEI